MDLNQQFDLYEEYIKATLSHFPVDQTKLNSIAVFKALAELTDEQKLNGAEFITREMLQARVSERYAANANARRQEVNKYLSQRFRISSDIEPDFVQFMLEDDSTVYSRADNVDPGSKRTAYRIADFPKKDKLIALLRRLDLTLYRLPKSELTLQGIFAAYLGAFWPYSPMQKWHENYAQFTRELRGTDQITDEQLTELWGKQSNGIALIKQGVTPAKEVVSAKKHLLKITSLLKNLSNNNRYQESLGIMNKASEDNSISRRYFSVLNRAAVAFDSANLTFPVDSNTMLKFVRFMNDAFNLNIDCKQADWYELSTNLKKAVAGYLAEDVDPLKVNIVLWRINDQQDALKNLLSAQPQMNEPIENNNSQGESKVNLMSEPLNQILYGPPGTGKTYHTIEAAVKAAEPARYQHIVDITDNDIERRQLLKEAYQELSQQKRIRFVTFHQSYGYEEFVEGLSVKTVDDSPVYFEKDGVFKQIVEDAHKHRETLTTHSRDRFDSCWDLFLQQLGNDEDGIKVSTKRTFFTVTSVDNGTIRFEKDKGKSTHTLSVKTLKAIFEGDRIINGGLNPYYSALVSFLHSNAANSPDIEIERQNYVLVIDEINRGNISKIFGELITLIEDSKRLGKDQTETIELVLPHSGDKFCVPDNLYIIGTMNTADRSLAMMDTALRRRFDFIEMMPNPSLLNGAVVKGIDLERLLTTLNERIEILYDREHTLGHAFFIPVRNLKTEGKEEEAFAKLVSVFQNKVVPLLQEYFFEDWQKIRLVLGDNQREAHLQLIEAKELKNNDLDTLFGKKHDLSPYGEALTRYKLKMFDKPVWQNAEVYRRMYAHSSKDNDAVIAQGETSTEGV